MALMMVLWILMADIKWRGRALRIADARMRHLALLRREARQPERLWSQDEIMERQSATESL
jgi:hypothetical protein